jgi:hypothetical protein
VTASLLSEKVRRGDTGGQSIPFDLIQLLFDPDGCLGHKVARDVALIVAVYRSVTELIGFAGTAGVGGRSFMRRLCRMTIRPGKTFAVKLWPAAISRLSVSSYGHYR